MDYRKRSSRNNGFVGVAVAIVLIGVAVCGYVFLQQPQLNHAYAPDSVMVEGQDEYAAPGRIGGDAWSGQVNDPYEFSYRINSSPSLSSEENLGNIMLENSQSNSYHMAVEILVEGETLVYRSGIIPPGYHIAADKLDTKLPDGVYEGKVVISVIEPESLAVIDAFEEAITLAIGAKQ